MEPVYFVDKMEVCGFCKGKGDVVVALTWCVERCPECDGNGFVFIRYPLNKVLVDMGVLVLPEKQEQPLVYCWVSNQEGLEIGSDEWADAVAWPASCMLLNGHDGPHVFTPDDEILVTFKAEVEGVASVNITNKRE